ncbi:MAG TPA: carboxypeptidase-like regulatory domain-containing protein [Thermoanaerobaculia bacterium]|jgi:protocatechuate 3,4-dioxygenase beta subunit
MAAALLLAAGEPEAAFRIALTGAKPPETIRVHLRPCDGRGQGETVSAPVRDGVATVRVRVGCITPTVTAGEFIALTLPSRSFVAGETHDYGSRRLATGAALLARVRSAIDGRPLEGVEVAVLAATELHDVRELPPFESLRKLASGTTRSDGWVRFDGLTADEVIVAMRARGARLPQLSDRFALVRQRETVMDELEWTPPGSLLLSLDLPTELRDAGLRLVRAEARRGKGLPITGKVTNEGARIDGLPAGEWTVNAQGRLGDGQAMTIASATATVYADSEQSVRLAVRDRLYRGRVTHRGQPVQGMLHLAARDRRSLSRMTELDDEGRFVVLLPNAGDYTAQVTEGTVDGHARAPRVAFPENDTSVEIRLPAASVRGVVVDEQQRPVARAAIDLTWTAGFDESTLPADRARTAHSDAAGRFAVDTLSPGEWTVEAKGDGGRSKTVRVRTSEEAAADSVRLVLRRTRQVAGRITTADGATVARAVVILTIPDPNAPGRFFREAVPTGADGTFAFDVPSRFNAAANVEVAGRDGSVAMTRRPIDGNFDVVMPAGGGDVRLRFDDFTAADGFVALVAPDGVFFQPANLRLTRNDTIRHLPPGPWRLVEAAAPGAIDVLLRGGGHALPAVSQFHVTAGERLDVVVTRGQGGSE